jgi:hypothetical protein
MLFDLDRRLAPVPAERGADRVPRRCVSQFPITWTLVFVANIIFEVGVIQNCLRFNAEPKGRFCSDGIPVFLDVCTCHASEGRGA